MPERSSFDWHNAHEYLEQLLPDEIRDLNVGGRSAAELAIQPTIGPSVAQLVDVLIIATRPKRVLEIGTSTGYSAIAMAKALTLVGGHLTTIEIDPRLARAAENNIREAGLSQLVDVIAADANDVIAQTDERFGLILQDGSKDDYLRMLVPLVRLLEPHGLLVTDDVLFPVMDLPDEIKSYRYALSLYNGALQEHPELQTIWLPIGDGAAVSVKMPPAKKT